MDVDAEAAAEAEAEAAAAQSAPNQPLFHCVTTNIDLILQLLHAVKLEKKEQMCRVYIASQGMKVVTALDKSRSVCAKAYLKKDLFSQYTLRRTAAHQQQQRAGAGAAAAQRANDYSCYLSLANMIDCMQLLGGSKDTPGAAAPVMHFKIEEEQHPLVISLDGSDGCGHTVLTECVLQVLEKEPEEEDGFQIGRDKLMACILNGPQLRYAFSELDLADAEELALHVRLEQDANGNQLPTMRMSTKGHGGLEVTCDFSRDPQSNLVFENNFEIFKGPFKLSYALRHLRPCIRALAKADMSNIRINAQGLLSIQHVMTSHSMTFWIEFFIAAREAPETDEGMPLPLPDGPQLQVAPVEEAIQLPDDDATHNDQQQQQDT